MKNLVSWQYIVGVFAIVAISLTGMLLVQQLASAAGNSVEMEITQRSYDWGVSKPGGQDEEDKHRRNLDENFRVEASHQGDQMAFKVFVPGNWAISAGIASGYISYDIEDAFHKYVDSKEDCNNQHTDDSVQMTIPESYLLESDDAIWPWTHVEVVDMYTDLTTMAEGRYSCLTVKLNGDVPRGADTHPQWTFVSPEPITQMADRQETSVTSDDWPEVRVVSSEESIRIYSLAGASGLRFYFKYRILDEGDRCDQSAFAVAPNHPAVHHSTQFNIPDSPETRAYYDNRYVCFQATIINIDHPAYAPGASIYRYRNVPIGLDFPVISVTRHSPWRSSTWSESTDPDAYLQLESSEVVTYRMRVASVAAASDGAASCQSFFEGLPSFDTPIMDASGKFMINAIGKVASRGICLEATDLDGNKVYSWIYDSTAGMAFVVKRLGQSGEEFHGWVGGTSGDVFWHVASPSESDTCNEANAFEGDGIQTLNGDRSGFIFKPGEGSRGKYYCFRATDELGNHFYRSMIHIEQQYIMPA